MTTTKATKRKKGDTTVDEVSTGPRSATTITQPTVLNGLLECYDFVAPNEYSEKTFGIQACLTRKSVGEINFSDVFDDAEKPNKHGQYNTLASLLADRRSNLPEIDASVEKCLMLNRLINFITENGTNFTAMIADIRMDMQLKMTDNHVNQTIQYPDDFRRREQGFLLRKAAQRSRRLFYHSAIEVKQPPSLIQLQNRTTEHLTYLLGHKMKYDTSSRASSLDELKRIFDTSFMVLVHPHVGVNPVTVYDRKGPGEYMTKISVTIVSLLHDFMQMNPNFIELYDVEPSLWPSAAHYKLEEPRSLSWKTCELRGFPGGKMRTFQIAEFSAITLKQTNASETRVRFAQQIHSFKFAIKLHLQVRDLNISMTRDIQLETMPFAIGAHNNQIPQLLSRIILDDIRLFPEPNDIKKISNYISRYFIHRTGIQPSDCVCNYLQDELTKAANQRSECTALEDIYLDFLVQFVHQVEFMAKHPLLAMFHADGLFLGTCNSERAADATIQCSTAGSPVIGLRFNSIRIDYSMQVLGVASTKAIRLTPCAIRVDIYNDSTKKLQNRTFDTTGLISDVSKFVSSAETQNADKIRILSDFNNKTNVRSHKFFPEFAKYYHERLHEISKADEKYKPVTDLIENVNDANGEEILLENGVHYPPELAGMLALNPGSVASTAPFSPHANDSETSCDGNSFHEYVSIPYDQSNSAALNQNVLSPSNQQQQPLYMNQQALSYLLAQPGVFENIVRQYVLSSPSAPPPSPQQVQQQQYPYQQPQPQFQRPPQYPQYSQAQQQFQQFHQQPYYPQQNQPIYQQQPQQLIPSTVIHHHPINPNQQQQPQFVQTNGVGNTPQQQLSTQMNTLQLSENNLTLPMPDIQTESMTTMDPIQQYITSGPITNEDLTDFTEYLMTVDDSNALDVSVMSK